LVAAPSVDVAAATAEPESSTTVVASLASALPVYANANETVVLVVEGSSGVDQTLAAVGTSGAGDAVLVDNCVGLENADED
jgi:hypothetical protein